MLRRIPRIPLLVGAALLLPQLAQAQQHAAHAGAPPLPAAVAAANDAYLAAWNGTDPAAVLAFYTPTAVVVQNGTRLAREELLERWIAPTVGRVTQLQGETQDVIADGNRVVTSGSFRYRSVPPDGAPSTLHGVYTHTWERQRDRSWKLRSSSVTNTPAPGATAVVRRIFEEGWNQRNFAVLDELVAPDAVRFDDATQDPARGPAMVLAFMQARLEEMPDLRFTIDEMLAQGNRVAVRWTATGTHRALGKPVRFHGTSLYRVENGQMVEGRSSVNQLPILQALGFTITPPQQLARQ